MCNSCVTSQSWLELQLYNFKINVLASTDNANANALNLHDVKWLQKGQHNFVSAKKT